MARTIAEIQQSIIDAKNANAVLSVKLTSSSKVAMWLLWTYIIATCIWVNEVLYDKHKAEVADIISKQKPHSLQWYVTKSKQFQYGDTLPDDTDVYAVIDETKMIVANAAAIELIGLIRIKVAKKVGSVLTKLTNPEKAAYDAYMARVKDAGVRLQLTSGNADQLRVELDVYYDPLVLDNTGARLDGTAPTPVQDAVNYFLQNLPFNGLFVINQLITHLQTVEGVRIADVKTCSASYALFPFVPISVEYTPDAGYMILDTGHFTATTTYTAHGPI